MVVIYLGSLDQSAEFVNLGKQFFRLSLWRAILQTQRYGEDLCSPGGEDTAEQTVWDHQHPYIFQQRAGHAGKSINSSSINKHEIFDSDQNNA